MPVNEVGPDALIGQVVDGRYQVLERIATGGMATVYRALDTRLDRDVALKVMRPHLAHDDSFVARFHREARAAARLAHPNIVGVFDQGRDGDLLFLVMEYVPGRNLRDIVDTDGALAPRAALDIFEPMLTALAVAHQAGFVHRDVKPENVLVRADGVVKVADFGLARAVTSETVTSATSEVLGTLSYISPEQMELSQVTPRSDVYGAGLVLFEMLTGRKAFTGESIPNVIFQHLHQGVPTPSTIVAGLAPELDDLVLSAAAKEPTDRPADAGELLARVRLVRGALGAALDDRPSRSAAATNDTSVLPTVSDPTEHTAPYAVSPAALTGATAGAAAGAVADGTRDPGGRAALPRVAPAPSAAGAGLATGGRGSGGRGSASPDDGEVSPHGAVPAKPLRRTAAAPAPAPPPPKRSRRGLLAAVLAVLLIAAGGIAAYLTIGPGAPTTVPTLAGLSVADAHTALDRAHLKAKDVQAFSEDVASGIVISAKPDKGAELRRGQTVTLTVSKGQERYLVPTLAGASKATATARLAKVNLELGPITQAYSDTVAKGRIISSDPSEGASVKRGTPVSIVISNGPQPFDVPDFRGMSLAHAQTLAEQSGLTLTEGDTVFSTEYDKDTVAAQDPAVGGQVVKGDTVTIAMSKGPEMVNVPSVFRMSEAKAVATLKAAGFDVKVDRFLGAPLDMCTGQTPPGGTKAPKGSTITITIV